MRNKKQVSPSVSCLLGFLIIRPSLVDKYGGGWYVGVGHLGCARSRT